MPSGNVTDDPVARLKVKMMPFFSLSSHRGGRIVKVKIWVGSFASCFIHGIHGGKIMGTMIIGTYVVLGVGAVSLLELFLVSLNFILIT